MTERERLIKQAEETFGVKAVPHGDKPDLSPLEKQLAEALIEQAKETVYESKIALGFSPLAADKLAQKNWKNCLTDESRAALTAAGYLNEEE